MDETSSIRVGPGRWGTVLCLAVCLLPIWASLGGAPVSGRSDGRYAAASRTMAEHGPWLMPYIDGRPHLTKPPLTYWAEAGAIKLFGANEFAVRFPSALAGSLVILGAFWLGRRLYGNLAGLCAAAVLSVMPLHVIVSRLTLTDALLSMFWGMSLMGGGLSILEPKRKAWPVLLWSGVALGWLTKPLAPWGAVGILGVWLIVGGRWRELLRFRWWGGWVLSLVPIAVWGYLVYTNTPDLLVVWEKEVLERAQGGGRHAEPFWYYLPVFLLTFFPATVMLELPGLNFSWQQTWAALRAGSTEALLGLAVVMPIVAFSIPEGKLATYILPAAAPAAILTGRMLAKWLTPTPEQASGEYKPPEVKGTLCIATVIAAIGGIVAGFVVLDMPYALMPLPVLIVAGATVWNWRVWSKGPAWRARGLARVWVTMALMWAAAFTAIGIVQKPYGMDALLAEIETRFDRPVIRTYGYRDYALAFYSGIDTPPVEQPTTMAKLVHEHGGALAIVALPGRWEKFSNVEPDLTARFEKVFEWHKFASDQVLWVMRPKGSE